MDRHVKPRLGQKKLTQLTAEDLRELYRFLLEQGELPLAPAKAPASLPPPSAVSTPPSTKPSKRQQIRG